MSSRIVLFLGCLYVLGFVSSVLGQGSQVLCTFDNPSDITDLFVASGVSSKYLQQDLSGGISGGSLLVKYTDQGPSKLRAKQGFPLNASDVYSSTIAWRFNASLLEAGKSGQTISLGWRDAQSGFSGGGVTFYNSSISGMCNFTLKNDAGSEATSASLVSGNWYRTFLTAKLIGGEKGQVEMETVTTNCGPDGKAPPQIVPGMSFKKTMHSPSFFEIKELAPSFGAQSIGGTERIDNFFSTPTLMPLPSASTVVASPAMAVQQASLTVPGNTTQSPQGMVLERNWDAPFQSGSATMKDLAMLISPFAKPSDDNQAMPGLEFYPGVTWLMKLADAKAALGLTQKVIDSGQVGCPGFPLRSCVYHRFDGTFEGHYDHLYLVTDRAEQVVCVQLVADKPKRDWLPYVNTSDVKNADWHCYNFVNYRVKANSKLWITQKVSFNEGGKWGEYSPRYSSRQPKGDVKAVYIESALIDPNKREDGFSTINWKPLEAARLYLPKPMMGLILHCIGKAEGR